MDKKRYAVQRRIVKQVGGMFYQYDAMKATQASAYLIAKYPGGVEYIKLIKMLYIANREALRNRRSPIVPDHFVSMPLGPVLSNLYREVSEPERGTATWKAHIKQSGRYRVKVANAPGYSRLSSFEMKLLDEVDAEWHGKSWKAIVDWTHQPSNIPEWSDPHGSSSPISISEVLSAVGLLEDEISEFMDEEREYQKQKASFAIPDRSTWTPDMNLLVEQGVASRAKMAPEDKAALLRKIARSVVGTY